MISFSTSSLISLFLHGLFVTALIWLPTAVVRRFEVAGQKQAITIEMTAYSEPSTSTIEIEATEVTEEHTPDLVPTEEFKPRDIELEQRTSSLEHALAMHQPTSPTEVHERPVELTKATLEPDKLPENPAVRPRQEQTIGAPAVSVVIPPNQSVRVDDKAVDLSNNEPPKYPDVAMRNRLEGVVHLRLKIDDQGYVFDVSIQKSSGHGILDQAAVDAVKQWKGKPAMRAGEAVASEEILPIRFKL